MDITLDVYNKALEWYQSGVPGKKEAALELFSEEELEKGVSRYNKEKKLKIARERRQELEKCLERCKKLFPIGTLVRSDDGTDHLPNLVISEPYISETEYHFPFFKHSWDYDKKETVLVKTVRICGNEPIDHISYVGLETVLYYMDKDKNDDFYRNGIIDLKEYKESQIKKRQEKIEWLTKRKEEEEKRLNDILSDLSEWEEYDPTKLTKEKIQEILKNYV